MIGNPDTLLPSASHTASQNANAIPKPQNPLAKNARNLISATLPILS
jgi:hypothetical protein